MIITMIDRYVYICQYTSHLIEGTKYTQYISQSYHGILFYVYFYYFKSDLKIYVFINQSLHLINYEYTYIKLVYIY